MSKIKLTMVALVALASVGVAAPGQANAAPAEWMLNGKTLAEEGLTSAALNTVAPLDKNEVLTGAGLTITCTGNLEGTAPEIIKSTKAKAKALIFTGCSSEAPCAVPATIGTVAVEGEATLDGSLAVKGIVKPQSGTVLTTIKITGAECAAAGNKPVTGDVEVLAPTGQDERTEQLLEVNQGATGLLKLGSASATLKGAALLSQASCNAWSLL